MMKMRVFVFGLICWFASFVPVHAQLAIKITTCGTAVPPSGLSNLYMDATGLLCTSATGGGGGGSVTQGTTPWVDDITQWANVALGAPSNYGTSPGTVVVPGVNAFVTNTVTVTGTGGTFPIPANSSVNVAQVNGVTTLTGAGATGTGSPRTTQAQDTTTIAGAAPGTASAPSANVITVQGAARTTVTSASVEANHIITAAAGSLYSFEVQADSTLSAAAWWIMIYNATTAPADGAVTPIKCYQMGSGVLGANFAFPNPVAFSTGIVIGVSTTGCFTKTASAHAFISGDF